MNPISCCFPVVSRRWLRRIVGIVLFAGMGIAAQAGVYLSNYVFSTANKPYVYTNESLPAPYKLRVKIIGVPGYPDGFHAVTWFNNTNEILESVPGPGTYTVYLYWVKYASDYATILEVGPQFVTSVTVQPASVNNVAWNAINLPAAGLPGQTISFTATVVNTGNTYWNSNYYLELKDWNQTHLYYPSLNGVSPGGATTATFFLTLPAAAGTYTYGFTALQNGVEYFGGTQYRTITVYGAPTITTQPASQVVSTGQPATFTVAASGATPLLYQWRKNGTNIGGATNASYGLAGVQAADAAGYSVVVSNAYGSATSATATLTVTNPQPVRLAVKYWSANDWPNREIGGDWAYRLGWHAGECRDVGEDTDGDGEDDTWHQECDPDWYGWGYDWVIQYAEDGLYGSRWDTTAGTFDINSTASSVSTPTTNRGNLLNAYNPGDLITFHLLGAAPSGNCSNYTWALFSPTNTQLAGNWFSGVYAHSFNAWYGSGYYRIDVSYLNATTTPANATVSYYIPVGIVAAPVITSQPTPASQTVAAGGTVSYSLTAPGATSYQWFKDGVAIAGANSTTLTLTGVQASDGGAYAVTASNSGGSVTSITLTLTVSVTAPAITTQPANVAVNVWQPASFTVAVSGSPPLTYQWRKNGVSIAGATTTSYSIANAQTADAAGYTVVVTNSAGSVTSASATLTVTVVPPSITSQPGNLNITIGQPASFSVTASGSAPLTYQWRKNGVNIAGATTTSYSIANAQTTDAAGYTVVVANSGGSVTSSTATLTVTLVAPSITTHPATQTVNVNQSVTFSVVASGSAPLGYQWRKNGGIIAGATSASYGITSAQTADAGSYSVVVSNSAGSATSNNATLTVLTVQPIRLAVKYWQANDWPNREIGGDWAYRLGWHAGECRDVGEDTDGDGEDDTWHQECDPDWYGWGYDWVVQYAEDGLYGSRWDTTAGNFDIGSTSSEFSPVSANRGSFLNSYAYWDKITFHVFSSAPSGNCSNFTWALFHPNGYQMVSGGFYGVFAWSFDNDSTGVYRVDVTYNGANANPPNATVSYYIPVGASTPSLPTITSQPSPASQTLAVGANASYSVTASEATSYQWCKGGSLISGATASTLTLNNVQLTDAGSYTVIVGNTAGSVTSSAATLTVSQSVPAITSALAASGTVGVAFTYTITATNSPTSFGAANLPAGLTVNSATGAISGIPTTAGSFNVSLTASNAGGTGPIATLGITISPAVAPPAISSSLAAFGTVGTVFNYAITATNSPTSFAATGLPTSLSLNTTTGVITGTPTIAGTFNVSLSATNAGGTSPAATLVLAVSPVGSSGATELKIHIPLSP